MNRYKSYNPVMVPTVALGLRVIDLLLMAIVGVNPKLSTMSGRGFCWIKLLAYVEKLSVNRNCPSVNSVSKANEDFPLPLTPVITVSLFMGILTSISFKLCV